MDNIGNFFPENMFIHRLDAYEFIHISKKLADYFCKDLTVTYKKYIKCCVLRQHVAMMCFDAILSQQIYTPIFKTLGNNFMHSLLTMHIKIVVKSY